LVRRRLASSRVDAQRLISTDRVTVKGMPTPKPASLVAADTPIDVVGEDRRWVSRGALKLLAAFETFPIDPRGKVVLDVGASTGGFSEVLLEGGAARVIALDVGTAQLHESLRRDPRVTSLEQTHFATVDVAGIGGPFDLVVADLSFISLCAVAMKLAESAAEGADLVVLVKPQFEAGRSSVGRGGVVRDESVRASAVRKVMDCLRREGLGSMGLIRSPIEGREGNVEYLLWLRKGEDSLELEVPA
jgi:23S rRNA (cytidine1920-2'-O)/16S rRNA (cytidine1409-2'-O)-methyltransferase